MKKLTTTSGVFGPFASVETLTDRFRCDGADMPFTVVGTGAVEDWTGPLPTPVPTTVPVPQAVTMRQARLALFSAGKLATVNAAIAGMTGAQGEAARIEWEFSSEVKRSQPLVLAMGPVLGMSDVQLDALFIAAAKL